MHLMDLLTEKINKENRTLAMITCRFVAESIHTENIFLFRHTGHSRFEGNPPCRSIDWTWCTPKCKLELGWSSAVDRWPRKVHSLLLFRFQDSESQHSMSKWLQAGKNKSNERWFSSLSPVDRLQTKVSTAFYELGWQELPSGCITYLHQPLPSVVTIA